MKHRTRLLLIVCSFFLMGCTNNVNDSGADSVEIIEETVEESIQEDIDNEQDVDEQQEDSQMQIKLTIAGEEFTATLEDNNTAKAFLNQLPLTLNMSDLNRNEKYYYLDFSVREDNASSPGTIRAGDIMCYGNDCLVLFYKTFSTSYSYVTIGHVEDEERYVKALGNGNVEVTFEMK